VPAPPGSAASVTGAGGDASTATGVVDDGADTGHSTAAEVSVEHPQPGRRGKTVTSPSGRGKRHKAQPSLTRLLQQEQGEVKATVSAPRAMTLTDFDHDAHSASDRPEDQQQLAEQQAEYAMAVLSAAAGGPANTRVDPDVRVR